jgi:hypothetical protein
MNIGNRIRCNDQWQLDLSLFLGFLRREWHRMQWAAIRLSIIPKHFGQSTSLGLSKNKKPPACADG